MYDIPGAALVSSDIFMSCFWRGVGHVCRKVFRNIDMVAVMGSELPWLL